MGLMGTLAKVAIGYAAARGVDKMSGGQGLGSLLGGGAQVSAQDPNAKAQAQMGKMMTGEAGAAAAGNPLQSMMEQMQKGGLGSMMGGAGGSNPMSAMMEKLQQSGLDLQSLLGGGKPGQGDGAKPGLLSQLSGGAGLAGILAAAGGAAASMQGKGAGALLDAMQLDQTAPQAEEAAGLMLRAMIQAAKADGGIDEAERAKILETIGEDMTEEDAAFLKAQFAAPVDAEALAADTPEAQRMQVYSASLMTIRVDTTAEAEYLDALAKAMGLEETVVNMLHMQMGMQPLYA